MTKVLGGLAVALLAVVLTSGCGATSTEAGDWTPTWDDDCPLWSPDGLQLAFGRALDAEGIYVLDRHKHMLRRVSRGRAETLSWSPDGRLVVARTLRPHRMPTIFLVDVETPRWEKLLDLSRTRLNASDADVTIRPSPDLRHIVVERSGEGVDDTWLIDRDGSHARRLLNASDVEIAWSPDSRLLAYSDPRPLANTLFLVGVREAGRARALAGGHRVAGEHSPLSWATSPVFAPDGRRIAYADTGSGFTEDVFVVDIQTGKQRQVTHESQSEETPRAWRADGSRLLAESGGGLLVTDLQGNIERRLPEWGGAWPGTGVNCPSFSPDGREVAFLRTFPAGFGHLGAMYLTRADLQSPHPLRAAGRNDG